MISAFKAFAADIKLSHSVFALPFVGVGLCLASGIEINGIKIVKIILCMIFARSFAMGANRILDAKIDAKNSRTSNRAIPSGSLTRSEAIFFTTANGLFFLLCSFSFSFSIGLHSLVLILILASYSLMKRITFLTHWYLGICLGLAPLAAELALTNHISSPVVLIGLAIAFWTAGFDILYSLQDAKFDSNHGLKSAPSVLGHVNSLILSLSSFVAMIVLLIAAGLIAHAGPIYFLGVSIVFAILAIEQWIVRDAWTSGVSKNIGIAFFNFNALVSVSFFICVLLDKVFSRNV